MRRPEEIIKFTEEDLNKLEPEKEEVLHLDENDIVELLSETELQNEYTKFLRRIRKNKYFQNLNPDEVCWNSKIEHKEQDSNGCGLACATMLWVGSGKNDLDVDEFRQAVTEAVEKGRVPLKKTERRERLSEERKKERQDSIHKEEERMSKIPISSDTLILSKGEVLKVDKDARTNDIISRLRNYRPVHIDIIMDFLESEGVKLAEIVRPEPEDLLEGLFKGEVFIFNISFTALVSSGRRSQEGEHAILIRGVKRNIDGTFSFLMDDPMQSGSTWIEDEIVANFFLTGGISGEEIIAYKTCEDVPVALYDKFSEIGNRLQSNELNDIEAVITITEGDLKILYQETTDSAKQEDIINVQKELSIMKQIILSREDPLKTKEQLLKMYKQLLVKIKEILAT